ncbi:MAG TPA: hypothetical protein VIP98_07105, partial [Microlunatus sp.]
ATSAGRRPRPLVLAAMIAGAVAIIALAAVLILQAVQAGNGPRVAPPVTPAVTVSPQRSESAGPSPSPSGTPTPSPTPPPDFDAIADAVKSGVVRVFATGCSDGTRIGSAFLVGKDTAVTSYAAVAGAKAIAITAGDETISATVRSADPEHGVVVLDLGDSVGGHVFDLSGEPLEKAGPTAVLGVPVDGSAPSVTAGEIADTDQTAEVAGTSVSGLATTSTHYDDGWAGAPTLAADGSASGMVVAGPQHPSVVPAASVKAALGGHQDLPETKCSRVLGPDLTRIGGHPTDPVEQLLSTYFGGINTGDYATAYAQLGPGSRPAGTSREDFYQGWTSSYDFNITVHSGDNDGAHVSFDSIFEPGRGPSPSISCARWDIDYEFISDNGRLLINKSQPHSGRIWHNC